MSKNIIKDFWNFVYENPRRYIKRNLFQVYNPVPFKSNLLIIDNFEPSFLLTGFRTKEFNFLLNKIPNTKLLTMSNCIYNLSDIEKRLKSKEMVWTEPMSFLSWKDNKETYTNYFNLNPDKLIFMQNRPYKANGAYIMFLYNAYLSLKFVEKNKIPFIFTLFPGGGLRLNHEFSDKMMKDVFSSPMFRGCFVPQKIIYDYILENKFTTEDKLFFEYGGGFFQFEQKDVLPKQYYKDDKDTFDICFIAYRYMEKGLDKGFDLALYSLKKLIKKYPFIHLHCVGTNTLDDFSDDFSDIKDNIHFYGSQKSEFFPKFFQKIDIALAPNRVNILDKGAFDGFPLMSEAGYFGVPIFCTDELGLNHSYVDKEDLVIIKPEIDDICNKIEYYLNNQNELKSIGNNGKSKIQKYFDLHKQEKDRLDFINKYLKLSDENK